jgi:hypothetical protein
LGHSLAQDHAAHPTNADPATQIGAPGNDPVPHSPDLQPGPDLQVDPAKAPSPRTIYSDLNDFLTLQLQPDPDLPTDNAGESVPNTVHSGLDGIATGILASGLELQVYRGRTLNPDIIVSDFDDTVPRGLAPPLLLDSDRSRFLRASEQAEPDPGTIARDTHDTPAKVFLPGIEKYRSKKLQSVNDELDDDDEAWKVDFYAVAMLLAFPLAAGVKKVIGRCRRFWPGSYNHQLFAHDKSVNCPRQSIGGIGRK